MFTNETTSFILRCVRKTIWMLLVLWGITLVSFFVIHLAPGTPTDMQTTLNPLAGEAARARLEALYGIDRPLYVQYFDWLSRIVQLDFGNSMSSDARPVIEKIAERLPLTIGINVISLLLTLLIAIPVGVISAWKQGSLFDKGMTVLVFLGFAMPGFWLALLLMLYTGLEHQWLPLSGLMSLDYESLSFWGKLTDLGRHLVLPITVITVGSVAGMSRFMRSSMLEVLRQDFILTYLGVHVVKKEQFLADEPRPIRKWVLTAIALHNRYALPALPEPYLTVTHVVRDADKLDIMRIMAQHLSRPIPTRDVVLRVQDAPQLWSQSIVDTVLSGGIPSYCDLHYVNDFRILLGSWIHDLHFPSSKKTCVASGFLQEVLQGLPDALELKPVTAYLLNQFSAVRNLCG